MLIVGKNQRKNGNTGNALVPTYQKYIGKRFLMKTSIFFPIFKKNIYLNFSLKNSNKNFKQRTKTLICASNEKLLIETMKIRVNFTQYDIINYTKNIIKYIKRKRNMS